MWHIDKKLTEALYWTTFRLCWIQIGGQTPFIYNKSERRKFWILIKKYKNIRH